MKLVRNRKFWADTFAMITFSIVSGAAVELLIVRLSLWQTVQIRLTGIPIDLIIGRPYGWLRDRAFQFFKATQGGRLRRIGVDTLVFTGTQIPIYAIVLFAFDATPLQTLLASGGVIAVMIISGRPNGMYLEFCRRLFGVQTKPIERLVNV